MLFAEYTLGQCGTKICLNGKLELGDPVIFVGAINWTHQIDSSQRPAHIMPVLFGPLRDLVHSWEEVIVIGSADNAGNSLSDGEFVIFERILSLDACGNGDADLNIGGLFVESMGELEDLTIDRIRRMIFYELGGGDKDIGEERSNR